MSSVATAFEEHRRLLFSIAYRMLGSVAEAEDVVQEAWLRRQGAKEDEVRSEKAFLSTIVTRLCLDQMKSARARRETYVGPWLPEPLPTRLASPPKAPDDELDERESVSMAFLILLESLNPVERAVFLLRKVFDYEYSEVARIVERSEDACRQIFHRASQAVQARRPHLPATREERERLADGFWQAATSGDVGALEALLAEDVSFWSDGGGKRPAAMNVVNGRKSVAALVLGLWKKGAAGLRVERVELNGCPAVIGRTADGEIDSAVLIEVDAGAVSAIRVVRNPDKLAHLAARA
jgi:RNA polymerase sigma-70 factor (ECF subfamily)